jgi:hypothetical protein
MAESGIACPACKDSKCGYFPPHDVPDDHLVVWDSEREQPYSPEFAGTKEVGIGDW